MNITIFDEVIYKYMDPTSSQFVVVSLVRAGMVYGNKFLWELLVFKKLWSISQEKNWKLQKESNEKRKLEHMQNLPKCSWKKWLMIKWTLKLKAHYQRKCEQFWIDRLNLNLSFLVITKEIPLLQSGMVSVEGKKHQKRKPKKVESLQHLL